MARFFSASDIARAAIEIERRGFSVYTESARAAESLDVKRFLEFFAAEEARHQAVFEKMAERLAPAAASAAGDDSEYMEYLQALLDSHALFAVGSTVDRRLSEAGNAAAAIELAIRFEKDTILFFWEVMDLLPLHEQGVVQKCLEEERSHLRQLSTMLASISRSPGEPGDRWGS